MDENALSKRVTEEAEKLAAVFRQNNLSKSQLRRFYNHLKQIQIVCDKGDEAFSRKLPIIKLTLAQVHYAGTRKGGGKITKEFVQFLTDELKKINTRQQFIDFMIFFEAVLGYCGEK